MARDAPSASDYVQLVTQESGENKVDEALHFLLGMGLGWLAAPAIAVETASLELSQPEGVSLGAFTTTVSTIAATLIVPSFYVLQQRLHLSVDAWVRIALLLQALSLALAAFAPHATIGRVSWALHTTAFLGSIAANLQRLAAMPWVMNGFPTSPSCVSWLLAGGNFSSLFCAVLGFLQRPGAKERFSVNSYFSTLLSLVAVSVVAFYRLLPRRPSWPPPSAAPKEPNPPPEIVHEIPAGASIGAEAQAVVGHGRAESLAGEKPNGGQWISTVARREQGRFDGTAEKHNLLGHIKAESVSSDTDWIPAFARHPEVREFARVGGARGGGGGWGGGGGGGGGGVRCF